MTIPISTKQRATLSALSAEVQHAQKRVDAYVLAIIEGAEGVPEAWQGASVTEAGLVLGDVPAPLEPPAP